MSAASANTPPLPATGTWDPIDLLELGDVGRTKPFVNKIWPQILGVVFGIGTGVMVNFGTRRPVFSGIHKHIIGVAGWTGALMFVQQKRDDYLAEKDAVLRHYIELHPDDFHPPERKKYSEIIEPWVPIR